MSPSQSFTSINDSFPKVCFNVEGNTFNIIAIVIFKLGICCTNVVNEPNVANIRETSSISHDQFYPIEEVPTSPVIDQKQITFDEPIEDLYQSNDEELTNSDNDSYCSSSTYLSDEYTLLLDADCTIDSCIS